MAKLPKPSARATKADLDALPDEVRELIAPHVITPSTLALISVTLCAKRDEAKLARTSSIIESCWLASEEAYLGIDDANRGEYGLSKWTKPLSMDGPVTTDRVAKVEGTKSTVFVRMTSRYVDAGAAKLAEILLPVDDKAFALKEMPEPHVLKALEDHSQVHHDGMGNWPLTRPAAPHEIAAANAANAANASPSAQILPFPSAGGAANAPSAPNQPQSASNLPNQPQNPSIQGQIGPNQPNSSAPQNPGQTPISAQPGAAPPSAPQTPRKPLTVADLANERIEIAHKSAKAAEKRIYDWLVASRYTAEVRKVIFDSARLGTGVLKGPFPRAKKAIAVRKSDSGVDIQLIQRVSPAVKWVNPWDIFPDPACGECIHDGDYCFERDYMTERQVLALKAAPGYISSQIEHCIAIGPKAKPDSTHYDRSPGDPPPKETRFEVWYFYGSLTREEMLAFNALANSEPNAGLDHGAHMPADSSFSSSLTPSPIYAIVTMIDDTPVKATINPLNSGSFPYHIVPWQRRTGSWAGVGIPEQIQTPQKIINGATRAMLDNAGIAAGPQVVVDISSIEPEDGRWSITPNKVWHAKRGSSASPNGVKDSFATFQLPNTTDPLMKVVNYALQLAEESTSIPLISEGQSGETTPDTASAAQLQDTNANQLLRAIGYGFDDYVTEPLIHQYYEWLLLDPDVPDEEKGEFEIEAHGSAALVERAIQDQTIAQMGNMVLNPNYGIDPKRWAKMMLRSKRIHPADLMYSEKELEQLAATPPPPAPAVQVAQIAAAVDREKLAASQSTDQRSTANEQQIAVAAQQLDSARVAAEERRTLADATIRLHELNTQRQIALLNHANARNISISDAQAELIKEAMKLEATTQISAADRAHDMHKHLLTTAVAAAKPPPQPPGSGASSGASSAQR